MSRVELAIFTANAVAAILFAIGFYLRTRRSGISGHWYFVTVAWCLIAIGGVFGWFHAAEIPFLSHLHAAFQLLAVISLATGLYLLYGSEKRRERDLRGLHDMSKLLVSIRDPDALSRQVLDIVRQTIPLKACMVALLDPKSGLLKISAGNGLRDPGPDDIETAVEYDTLCKALDSKQTLQVENALETVGGDVIASGGCGSYSVVPIVSGDRPVGLFVIYRALPSKLAQHEIQFLNTLAPEAGLAIENARLYQDIQNEAEVMSAMVREMHHRIKNNLQAIASLLALELLEGSSLTPEECIRHSIARVKSIAAVHELVSLENSGITDIKQLAERIVDVESRSLRQNGREVLAEVSGPSIFLPSDRATAFALVLNELVGNSIQHGLADTAQGKLRVTLEDLPGQVVLVVADNGCGLPQDFESQTHRGLGLQIAETLVRKDLAGKMTLSNGNGTEAKVVFPK